MKDHADTNYGSDTRLQTGQFVALAADVARYLLAGERLAHTEAAARRAETLAPNKSASAAGVLAFGFAPQAAAVGGPMSFEPIAGSAYGQQTAAWTQPFIVPNGCTQRLVSDETVLDIYPGVDDLTDMNVTNETGKQAGRYLYRTHEVGSNGSVSVVDLQTGETKVLVQDAGYRRLDGLTWTPWGTRCSPRKPPAAGSSRPSSTRKTPPWCPASRHGQNWGSCGMRASAPTRMGRSMSSTNSTAAPSTDSCPPSAAISPMVSCMPSSSPG